MFYLIEDSLKNEEKHFIFYDKHAKKWREDRIKDLSNVKILGKTKKLGYNVLKLEFKGV